MVEFIEGEPCKFGISTGKSQSEMKYIFKVWHYCGGVICAFSLLLHNFVMQAKTIEAKQDVVKTLRHIVQQGTNKIYVVGKV